MGRISTSFLFMRLTSVFVLFSPANCLPFSVEDRLHQLTEDFVHMKEVLAAKDARLQQVTDDLHLLTENFEEKNVRLELKVNRLEEIVQQQETQIAALQQKEKPLNEFIPSHLSLNSQRTMGKTVSFPRTCRELRAADPTLTSGLHRIDPDGNGVGDDPIQVYCDMTKGSTSIVHDTESAMDVGHCAEPGCYSRPVNYNSTMRQINALFELSSECHQSIQYDCNYAPLQLNGISYAWWNDVNGVARYFWSGSDASAHICQCGIENNCVEPSMPCNCDSTVPVPLTDKGVITDKSFLPIKQLNFGRTQLASSSGIHTLGRPECTGQVTVTGMPKSCADLWRIGHSLNGIYYVMGTELIEPVYCDFSKLPTESGFQTKVNDITGRVTIAEGDINNLKKDVADVTGRVTIAEGNINNLRKDVTALQTTVNAPPIYFYVQRSSSFSTKNVPIPFELERLNVGGAMNSGTGTFTAPRRGIYFFSFSGIGNADNYIYTGLSVNGNRIGTGHATNSGGGQTFTLQSALQLNAGDQVTVQIYEGNGFLPDEGRHFTHFTGFLLHTL